MNWKQLKSGTDIRGVAVGDKAPVTLTDPVVAAIASAFAAWLADKKKKEPFGADYRGGPGFPYFWTPYSGCGNSSAD